MDILTLVTIIISTVAVTVIVMDARSRKSEIDKVTKLRQDLEHALKNLSQVTESQANALRAFDERVNAVEFNLQAAKTARPMGSMGYRE